jgi:hypothetical protein
MEPSPHALSGDELHRGGFVVHLAERRGVGLESELRHEAERADETQWILREAPR